MTTFPALIPSSRTFTPGDYPATAFSGYSGAQGRVRHSNVFLSAQLRLSYIGLSEAQMLQIWNHYANRQGTFKSFTLPVEALSGSSITDYVPGTYRWIYSGPGQVEDLPCGGHNVSLSLETVPSVSASVIGADLRLRLSLVAGASAAGAYADGIVESITFGLLTGNGFIAINGLNKSITLSLAAGSAVGDGNAPGFVDGGIALSIFSGFAFDLGAGSFNEIITLSLTPGEATAESTEPNIGDAYGGGYFAGYISHTADGVATHRLIVAPEATGATGTGHTITTNPMWKTSRTATAGTTSDFDGLANTDAMIAAAANDHPAAKFCADLTISGFSDWYLPARAELDIAYANLKPGTTLNNTSAGVNAYSVPKRTIAYTSGDPGQTPISAFQLGQSEAFQEAGYWSSTESTNSNAWAVVFSTGVQGSFFKNTTLRRVRAFRREAI